MIGFEEYYKNQRRLIREAHDAIKAHNAELENISAELAEQNKIVNDAVYVRDNVQSRYDHIQRLIDIERKNVEKLEFRITD